jgi:hypothetical protein
MAFSLFFVGAITDRKSNGNIFPTHEIWNSPNFVGGIYFVIGLDSNLVDEEEIFEFCKVNGEGRDVFSHVISMHNFLHRYLG